jgi:23S rRNA pseudouridine1911/1915/1917 synthase
MSTFTHPENLPAERLDRVLARNLGLGLRRCRALIDGGHVLVDDRPLPKGGLVRPGQQVRVSEPGEHSEPVAGVEVVARDGGFAALFKPGGVHSVAGKGAPNLEGCLPGLGLQGWALLNRLDFLTSGLVLAGAGAGEAALYKGWQDGAQVFKWYLALAHGAVDALELGGIILDDKRRVVRVTDEEDVPLRRTLVAGLRRVGEDTLVLVRILKGRRHQIRAHLAHAGHPLVGDPVYGAGESGGLFLHHWRVDMPGFSASRLPAWPFVDLESAETVRVSLCSSQTTENGCPA